MRHLLANLAELAERRARNVREEAQMWDILSRDLKRAAKGQEAERLNRPVRSGTEPPERNQVSQERLYVRVKEAQKMMGMGHTSIYKEIKDGRLPIKKSGKKTLIAVADIHAWLESLPEKI